MKFRIRHFMPPLVVAVALATSGTLVVASTGSGADPANPSHQAASGCKPAPARCGSDVSDLVIAAANEAARRMLELETTSSTTVINPGR